MNKIDTTEIKQHEMLDPDARFLLANERTLLAWVRTALALLAGGIALLQFGHDTDSKTIVGIAAIAMGAVTAMIGLVRFRSADVAIRKGQLPAAGSGPQVQVVAVIVFALVLVAVETFKLL